jgi:hypothetical protein
MMDLLIQEGNQFLGEDHCMFGNTWIIAIIDEQKVCVYGEVGPYSWTVEIALDGAVGPVSFLPSLYHNAVPQLRSNKLAILVDISRFLH